MLLVAERVENQPREQKAARTEREIAARLPAENGFVKPSAEDLCQPVKRRRHEREFGEMIERRDPRGVRGNDPELRGQMRDPVQHRHDPEKEDE